MIYHREPTFDSVETAECAVAIEVIKTLNFLRSYYVSGQYADQEDELSEVFNVNKGSMLNCVVPFDIVVYGDIILDEEEITYLDILRHFPKNSDFELVEYHDNEVHIC